MAAGELAQRVALVTGAGRGIGRGCAERLARAGATVVLVARTEDDLRACAEAIGADGGDAYVHRADVTIEDGVAAAVAFAESVGDLRICVNAAGTNLTGPARDYPMAQWDTLFAVNVRATFLVCRAVGDSLLRRAKPGSIVNVSSQMGHVGYPGRAAYCATKHAVEGLSKALAVEWAADGIRVNTVAPTFVDTDLTRSMLTDTEFRADVMARLPTRRLATIEEVAAAVSYLVSDAASGVTGHALAVDGGWTAW
ncbi:MAG: SDR family NAD(P)-dependent oxidoreductase [Solirubrobacteraceae bacterium]|jgi:NAD(P)-dependent dehydrogenase (short-subunit alcohol dehydrogenase family)